MHVKQLLHFVELTMRFLTNFIQQSCEFSHGNLSGGLQLELFVEKLIRIL
jgi:hypothetical protein